MGHTGAPGSSAITDDVAEISPEVAAFLVFERISSSRFIGASLLGPVAQDALDVAPVADVEFGRLAEGVLDPFRRVGLLGFHKPVANHGGNRADVLFVEGENARGDGRAA